MSPRQPFSVRLIPPGEASPELIERLDRIRRQACLPAATGPDIAALARTCSLLVGSLGEGRQLDPLAVLYLVFTADWVRTWDMLVGPEGPRVQVPLAQAAFINILDFDCTRQALNLHLGRELLSQAFALFDQQAPADYRVITYSPALDLQPLCRQFTARGAFPTGFFDHAMRQVADACQFRSTEAMAARFGPLEALMTHLGDASRAGFEELGRRYGAALRGFLSALAKCCATVLYDPDTGHDLCEASHFHRYHGARLAEVVPDSDTHHLACLGVVLHFEYRFARLAERRRAYAALRRQRRLEVAQQAAAQGLPQTVARRPIRPEAVRFITAPVELTESELFRLEYRGPVVVVRLTQRIITQPPVIERLGKALHWLNEQEGVRGMVVDFFRVHHVSTPFLRSLLDLRFAVSRRGGKLCLSRLSAETQRVVRVIGLHRLVALHEHLEEAVLDAAAAAGVTDLSGAD